MFTSQVGPAEQATYLRHWAAVGLRCANCSSCRAHEPSSSLIHSTCVPCGQVAREFGAELKTQALVRVQEANVSAVGDGHLLIVAKAELLGAGEHVAAKLAGASAVAATPAEPMQGVAAPVEPAAEAAAKTPAAALRKTSAALAKTSPYATPANHPTPPSAGW